MKFTLLSKKLQMVSSQITKHMNSCCIQEKIEFSEHLSMKTAFTKVSSDLLLFFLGLVQF